MTAVDQTQLSDSACFTIGKQTIECIFWLKLSVWANYVLQNVYFNLRCKLRSIRLVGYFSASRCIYTDRNYLQTRRLFRLKKFGRTFDRQPASELKLGQTNTAN